MKGTTDTITDRPIDKDEIDARIAELRYLPDGQVSDRWEECPLCNGHGCGHCDRTGRLHPKRRRWIENGVAEASVYVPAFMRLLETEHVGPAAWRRAMLDLNEVTSAHLRARLEADPALEGRYDEAVEAVLREAQERADAELAETAEREVAAAEAILRAAGES